MHARMVPPSQVDEGLNLAPVDMVACDVVALALRFNAQRDLKHEVRAITAPTTIVFSTVTTIRTSSECLTNIVITTRLSPHHAQSNLATTR